ncbi:MAG: sulfurtransferase [Gammaproteobacteria bacterium]|nr:sulfurtransferase [Gammaproteobacteria bacterium]MBU1656128.1 sulfurtransferase [Gammaproteobacteria bacterium]MBU1960382.1 sulfurtransferase [Gammaproteobacteria bacterium]
MFVKEIDVSELKSRLGEGANIRLLDIRSDAEVAGGMLPNSEHLAMHLIPLKMQEFSDEPEQEVILYCRSGARSYHACMYLMQQGISNVVNLRGGIISWAQQGYEILPLGRSSGGF